jgi:aerobic carbon-monoxide dehydrogenase medium subunit
MYTTRPSQFDYHRPTSLDEAIDLLATLEDARPLAGGHSLLPTMKLRLSTPAALVDIGRLPGLDGISKDGDVLTIGGLATHASVARSDVVRAECPVLAETAGLIGDQQVRNRGTIGGSVAHADPAADYPTVLKALGATITATGKGGTRDISADDFFVSVFTTALEQGELVTSVKVPVGGASTGAAYRKHAHPASRYAVVGVAARVELDGGTCQSARIVVGGAVGTPVHAESAAASLVGQAPSEEAISNAADKVSEALTEPIGDVYASGEYRVHLAGILARKAIAGAVEQAG